MLEYYPVDSKGQTKPIINHRAGNGRWTAPSLHAGLQEGRGDLPSQGSQRQRRLAVQD